MEASEESPLADVPFLEIAFPVVTVVEYDPTWPNHFQDIDQKLKRYLDRCLVRYLSIEHVGSTSVPGLAAKPNIDIIIEVSDAQSAEAAKQALSMSRHQRNITNASVDGGIKGRISMKLHDRSKIPDQSIYIVNREDPYGRVLMRCHRALCGTLRRPEHESLKIEYGQTKIELASSALNGVEYGQKKNPIIRRILRAAGWSEAEIDEKERLDYRTIGARRTALLSLEGCMVVVMSSRPGLPAWDPNTTKDRRECTMVAEDMPEACRLKGSLRTISDEFGCRATMTHHRKQICLRFS